MSLLASAETVFVDTNVLVYAHDASETVRQPIAQAVLSDLWQHRTGALSTQVLQEFYVVATRKFDPPMSRRDARDLVDAYSQWQLVQIDTPLILAASQLEERHTLSFWDALIIEAAHRAGAGRLLSEDLQTGRRVAGLAIENPFADRTVALRSVAVRRPGRATTRWARFATGNGSPNLRLTLAWQSKQHGIRTAVGGASAEHVIEPPSLGQRHVLSDECSG